MSNRTALRYVKVKPILYYFMRLLLLWSYSVTRTVSATDPGTDTGNQQVFQKEDAT
jgi:hypothetical protein